MEFLDLGSLKIARCSCFSKKFESFGDRTSGPGSLEIARCPAFSSEFLSFGDEISGLWITQTCQISCIFIEFLGCNFWALDHARLGWNFWGWKSSPSAARGSSNKRPSLPVSYLTALRQSINACHQNSIVLLILPIISVILARIILETFLAGNHAVIFTEINSPRNIFGR